MFTLFEAGGTRFSMNWIPLGGFVRLSGENDPDVEGEPGARDVIAQETDFVSINATLSNNTAEVRSGTINVSSVGLVSFAEGTETYAGWTDPEGERVVADGEWLWAFAPSSVPDQVIRQPVPQAGPSSPRLMAQFVERPLERYAASYLREEMVAGEMTDVILLLPKLAETPFKDAEISVARSDGLLRRIRLTEVSGQKRTLVLSYLRTNQAIAEHELRFQVPDGTRIITP